MEKRAETRFDTDRAIRVTLLGTGVPAFPARVTNVSGTGMRLVVDRAVVHGVPIQAEWDETLLLGEVCYCERLPEGYAIGVQLEHALLHTGELARLSQMLLGEEDAVLKMPPVR